MALWRQEEACAHLAVMVPTTGERDVRVTQKLGQCLTVVGLALLLLILPVFPANSHSCYGKVEEVAAAHLWRHNPDLRKFIRANRNMVARLAAETCFQVRLLGRVSEVDFAHQLNDEGAVDHLWTAGKYHHRSPMKILAATSMGIAEPLFREEAREKKKRLAALPIPLPPPAPPLAAGSRGQRTVALK